MASGLRGGPQKSGKLRLNVGIFTPECASYQYLICAWDKYAHDRALGYYKQGLHAAGQMGAKYMLTNCCGGDWNEEYERTFERAVNTLRELAPIAADNGVTLAVETVRPEESKVIITLPELKRLIDAVGHPNVKAALDTIAMGVAGESPEEWFRVLGSDIVHTHFVDGRPYGHLVWGDGLYPLDDFIQVLNDNLTKAIWARRSPMAAIMMTRPRPTAATWPPLRLICADIGQSITKQGGFLYEICTQAADLHAEYPLRQFHIGLFS